MRKGSLKRLAVLLVCVITIVGITALSYASWSGKRTQETDLKVGNVKLLKLSETDSVVVTDESGATVTNGSITLIPIDESDAVLEECDDSSRYFKVVVTVEKAEIGYQLYISRGGDTLESGSSLRYAFFFEDDDSGDFTTGSNYKQFIADGVSGFGGTAINTSATAMSKTGNPLGSATEHSNSETYEFYIFLVSDDVDDAGKDFTFTVELRAVV